MERNAEWTRTKTWTWTGHGHEQEMDMNIDILNRLLIAQDGAEFKNKLMGDMVYF
jgi:hypothetical protein